MTKLTEKEWCYGRRAVEITELTPMGNYGPARETCAELFQKYGNEVREEERARLKNEHEQAKAEAYLDGRKFERKQWQILWLAITGLINRRFTKKPPPNNKEYLYPMSFESYEHYIGGLKQAYDKVAEYLSRDILRGEKE